MENNVKGVIKAIETTRDCVKYIEHHMPELNEIDVDYQRKIVMHLNNYISMLENLEVNVKV